MTLYRGKIKQFTSKGLMIEVPALGKQKIFGPCEALSSGSYEIEQPVLVTNINGIKEDLAVLGPLTNEIYEDIIDGGAVDDPDQLDGGGVDYYDSQP